MPYVDLKDFRMYYEWCGAADSPVLVLSNSLGTDLSMWDPQVEAFSKLFRVLRYDTRGHGRSATTPGPYTIEQLSRDAIAMLDALAVRRAAFCGLSMGGMIGQWLSINAPKFIERLVLADTAAKIGTPEGWNVRIHTVLAEGMRAVVPAILDRWFTPAFQTSSPEVVAATGRTLEATDPAGYVACCAAVRDMDERETVHRICTPTLVITGAEDTATSPVEGRYLADRIRGARYLSLRAAHLSNIEAAREFTAAVVEFLSADERMNHG